MSYLFAIAIGVAVGVFSPRLIRTDIGVLTAIVLGIGGAMIGSTVSKLIMAALGLVADLVGAAIGAIAVIWLWNRFMRKQAPQKHT